MNCVFYSKSDLEAEMDKVAGLTAAFLNDLPDCRMGIFLSGVFRAVISEAMAHGGDLDHIARIFEVQRMQYLERNVSPEVKCVLRAKSTLEVGLKADKRQVKD